MANSEPTLPQKLVDLQQIKDNLEKLKLEGADEAKIALYTKTLVKLEANVDQHLQKIETSTYLSPGMDDD